ncbi:DUF998 domain-containing protein [Streptomyces sp. NPDC048442]|uniref:DUF998 domain-containing protein n=1 Tax=Streptomyces sp. NPDC048442 TaxID=3154823 RepID=UPI00341D65CF
MGNQVLLTCGVVAGPLFTLVYLLAGARRADYEPFRHPVSSLALGRGAWVQTANFFLTGSLSLLFAVGLWRAGPSGWGAVLVGAWAVGLLGAGVFRTDPVGGYPSGTPDQLQHHTRAGALHDLFSFGGFLALAAACFVFASSQPPGWAAYSVVSGVLFATAMVLSSAAYGPHRRWDGLGGLLQRISLGIGWSWQMLLAMRTLCA